MAVDLRIVALGVHNVNEVNASSILDCIEGLGKQGRDIAGYAIDTISSGFITAVDGDFIDLFNGLGNLRRQPWVLDGQDP